MGIRLFQLIISHIFTDKIMNIFLLFPFRQILCRSCQLLYPDSHCLLVLPDFIFVKQILRYKDQIRRVLVVFILISCHPENLRMIQPKPEKDIIKLRTFYARYLKFIRKRIRSLHDYMVCCLLCFSHSGIVKWFHENPPEQCFDSPIIPFFTKTRNVFPYFLTKNRNVYAEFLTKTQNVCYFLFFPDILLPSKNALYSNLLLLYRASFIYYSTSLDTIAGIRIVTIVPSPSFDHI